MMDRKIDIYEKTRVNKFGCGNPKRQRFMIHQRDGAHKEVDAERVREDSPAREGDEERLTGKRDCTREDQLGNGGEAIGSNKRTNISYNHNNNNNHPNNNNNKLQACLASTFGRVGVRCGRGD
jgi:hypothetical protein